MSEYGSDLTGLFVRPGSPQFEVLQGEVLAWDAISGANTIRINGTLFTDLPFLSPGTTVQLYVGDAVMILRLRNALFVLGRTLLPGGIGAVGRVTTIPQKFAATPGANFSVSTTLAVKATVDLVVPVWATLLTMQANGRVNLSNVSGAARTPAMRLALEGGTFEQYNGSTIPNGSLGAVAMPWSVQTVVTPGDTLTLDLLLNANGSMAADPLNYASLDALCLWTS